MRTFPAMITISVGLGLNQRRLHRGENGLALGQAQSNGLGGNHICRPVAGDHFAGLNAPGCFRKLQQNPPLHAISPVIFRPELYSTPNFETVSPRTIEPDSFGSTSHGRHRATPRSTERMVGWPMARLSAFAAPIWSPPEGSGGVSSRPLARCPEEGTPPSKPPRGHRRPSSPF
jgi:hypothetical protein